MDNLLEEVALKLGLTVEGVIEAYPMLRSQYIKVTVIENIRVNLALIVTILLIISILMFARSMKENYGINRGDAVWKNGEEMIKKEHWDMYKKKIAIIIVAIIVIIILLGIGKTVVAPDYMLLINLV